MKNPVEKQENDSYFELAFEVLNVSFMPNAKLHALRVLLSDVPVHPTEHEIAAATLRVWND